MMEAKASSKMAAGKIAPRKRMAGAMDKGGFGVGKMVNPKGPATPGPSGMMQDGNRGIGMPIKGKGGMHPQQAAPKHG